MKMKEKKLNPIQTTAKGVFIISKYIYFISLFIVILYILISPFILFVLIAQNIQSLYNPIIHILSLYVMCILILIIGTIIVLLYKKYEGKHENQTNNTHT